MKHLMANFVEISATQYEPDYERTILTGKHSSFLEGYRGSELSDSSQSEDSGSTDLTHIHWLPLLTTYSRADVLKMYDSLANSTSEVAWRCANIQNW